MKIFVKNLIPFVAIFIHFRESSSSGKYGAGSSRAIPHDSTANPITPPLIIHYKGRDIEVSFQMKNGYITPADCKVLGEHYGVPTLNHKAVIDFITRALMYGGMRYCVIYETGNGEVLGAKLPPMYDDQLYTGDPRDFNPDTSKCYITYLGLDFEVSANLVTGNTSNIKLLPHNITPDSRYIHENDVDTIPVTFGGLYFLLYRTNRVNGKPEIKYVGAALDPHWRERSTRAQLFSL